MGKKTKKKRKGGCLSKILGVILFIGFLVSQIKFDLKLPLLPWFNGKPEFQGGNNTDNPGDDIEELFPELEIPNTDNEKDLGKASSLEEISHNEILDISDTSANEIADLEEVPTGKISPVVNSYGEMKLESSPNVIEVDTDLTKEYEYASYSDEEVKNIIDGIIEETLASARELLEESKSETIIPEEMESSTTNDISNEVEEYHDLTDDILEERVFPDKEEMIIDPKLAILHAIKEGLISIFKPITESNDIFTHEDKTTSPQYEEPKLLAFSYEDTTITR